MAKKVHHHSSILPKRSVIVGILNEKSKQFRTIFVRTRKEIVPEIGFQSIIPPNHLISSINRFLKRCRIDFRYSIIIILLIRLIQSYFCQIGSNAFLWSPTSACVAGKFRMHSKIRSDGIPKFRSVWLCLRCLDTLLLVYFRQHKEHTLKRVFNIK